MHFINYLRVRFRNNFYSRMVILYSTVIIFCFAISFAMFINFQNRSLTQTKLNDYTNKVTQFQIYSDQYLLDRVYSIMTKDIFTLSSNQFDSLLDPEIYKYNKNDFSSVLNFKKFLYDLHSNIDFIDSIDVYNKEFDTYISSTTGVYYNILEDFNKYKNIFNYDLLKHISSGESNQFWLAPSSNGDSPVSNPSLTFVQLMPIFRDPIDCNVALIIHLDMSKIFSAYFSQIDLETENFKILDNRNQLIFDTNVSNLNTGEVSPTLIETISEADSGSETIEIDGEKYNIVWTPSMFGDWKYVYHVVYTDLFSNIISSFSYILICCILIFAFAIAAILIISKWLYKPLNQLVTISKNKLQNSTTSDDLHIISEAFTNINSKLSQLEGIVEKNNVLILNNIISDLINSKVNDLAELNERLKLINKKFISSSFYLLIIKLDEKEFAKLSYEEKELIPLAISELLKDYFNYKYNNTFKMSSLFNYDGYFTCVINLSAEDYFEECNDAKEILDLLRTEFSGTYNIALSGPIEDLPCFHDQYQATLDYFKYSFIYGDNNVFTQKSITSYEQSPTQFSMDVIRSFDTLLKTHKFDLLKEELAILFDQIKVHGSSYLYTYNLSIQIIGIISNECITQNISSETLNQHSLLDNFSKIRDLSQSLQWFYSIIDEFATHIAARNTNIDNSFIQDILEYIKNNVDSQLSLNSVAEHFGMSTGHLSRLFKEKVGTNFSDFVGHIKFEKATHLLLSDPKAKVSDIADELGYSNLTYFTKLFKEKYGMTPTQYRKSHRE